MQFDALWRLRLVAFLILLGPSTTSFAADSIVKPDPPEEWRFLGLDDGSSDSKCLGVPAKTPVCAIENFFACELRADARYCEISAAPTMGVGGPLRDSTFIRYRFVSSLTAANKDWRKQLSPRIGGHGIRLDGVKRGDLLVLGYRTWCKTKTDCKPVLPGQPPGVFVLRRVQGAWIFATQDFPHW
jgi:hypothetical protein